MYTLLYLKWITNKDLPYSTGNSAQRYVATWMGGGLERDWIHVHVWLSHSGFQVALVVKNSPANAGDIRDTGSIPGSGRFPVGR